MFRSIPLFLVCVAICFHALAQKVVVQGSFLSDSVKIGARIPYALSVHHPAALSVVFPDSTFSYSPFEIQSKTYFPTRTQNQISIDSAVYLLSTFEIDSLQSLALPVFVIHAKDCTAVYAQSDTVVLKQLVGSIPESVEAKDLPLKSNADYLNVKWLLNYPLLLIIGGALLLVLIIVWIVFGKRIRKYYALRRLTKSHFAFLDRYAAHVEKLKTEGSSDLAERILVIWKKYMEGLLAKPYTKFTTREILRVVKDENLINALHDIDRMVYARDGSYNLEAFDQLRGFSQIQFEKKTQEVKHG